MNLYNAVLVDEWISPRTADWLRSQGYEICSVFETHRGMSDDDIIHKCLAEQWILLTNDKDFGQKVYRERALHRGVVLLRLKDERPSVMIEVLKHLLYHYASRLPDAFLVVTEKQVRFAREYQLPS